jgi:hypothetical protein
MMRKYLILAQSQVTAQALNALLPLLGQPSIPQGDKRLIIWDTEDTHASTVISSYESLVSEIDQAARNDDGILPLSKLVVLVDWVKPLELSAIHEEFSWDNLLALLILTFPEIHWCFGFAITQAVPIENSFEGLVNNGLRNSLLDAVGLRSHVRIQTNRQLEEMGDDLKLPVREKRAAVIDEEKDYAYFNGYTAYRFGSVTDVITTWAMMEQLFGGNDPNPHGYWLLLEDMSLNFADKPRRIHLLKLRQYDDEKTGEPQGRAYWCPKLDSRFPIQENSEYRFLVTTGQARDTNTLTDNESYLNEWKKGRGKPLYKPAKGMFGLWEDAGLFSIPSWFKVTRRQTGCDCLPGEPHTCALLKATSHSSGHGAPGKLMLVADMLIRRSRALLDKATAVETAVQGAVLATEALELTGRRTPTTAIDALTLKHQFEVLAECQFYGVEHHIDTKKRWEDIETETGTISLWFQVNEVEKAKLDAQMHILNRLVRIFREHNKFEEEQQFMNKARNVHHSLWLKKRLWRRPFTPLVRYFEFLMRSFLSFVVCVVAIVAAFAFLFMRAGHYPTYWHGLFDSVSSLVAISGPASHEFSSSAPAFGFSVIVSLAIVAGVAHLGVFVSHLYTLISRK